MKWGSQHAFLEDILKLISSNDHLHFAISLKCHLMYTEVHGRDSSLTSTNVFFQGANHEVVPPMSYCHDIFCPCICDLRLCFEIARISCGCI